MIVVECQPCGIMVQVKERIVDKREPQVGDFFRCPLCMTFYTFYENEYGNLYLRTATEEEIKNAMSSQEFARHANSEYN
jgi:predicted RNA-binding Zn-ribbon protein involved in translation (DUF1610 family)